MSVNLTTHEKGDVMIVGASGRLTLGEGTSALRKSMRELVDAGTRRIVLDMADVTYIDSSGVGELVAAYTTVTAAGGELKISTLGKRVHDLLYITKLCTVFESFEDEASAIASFAVAKPTELQAQI